MRIRREDVIAVAVDYQEKLVPVMYGSKELIDNSSILLAGLKELGIPILVTQQYTKGLGTTVEEITSASGRVDHVEKICFSAYQDIEPVIREKKCIILCGIEAHICVLQTLIDLRADGYEVVLLADCISSRKERDREYAIRRAEREGALISTYESLLFELLEKAGSDTSKKIQRLIK